MFTGVLFDALDHASLSAAAKRRARLSVLVFSALFGATALADRIPAFRLSVGAKLPGLPGLAAHWRPVLTPALDALAAMTREAALRTEQAPTMTQVLKQRARQLRAK